MCRQLHNGQLANVASHTCALQRYETNNARRSLQINVQSLEKATRLNWCHSVSAVDECDASKAAYYHGDGQRNMLQITCSKLFS